jgi:hypothetical protein
MGLINAGKSSHPHTDTVFYFQPDCFDQYGEGIKTLYTATIQIQKCVVCINMDDMPNPMLNTTKLVAHILCKEGHKKFKISPARMFRMLYQIRNQSGITA